MQVTQPEPVTPTSPRPVRRAVLFQSWHDVAFVHWAVPPAAVERLLPAGVRPDLFDGLTYVGVVAFRSRGTGGLGLPALPYLGSFAETNVRLYSVDAAGRRGVVFCSLDAARLLPALAGRWIARVPYYWSWMRVRPAAGGWDYRLRRRWPGRVRPRARLRVEVGDRVDDPSELDQFLTARWGLHTSTGRRTVYLPNEHPAWQLYRARAVEPAAELPRAVGIPVPDGAPNSVLWSPGVPVRFGTWVPA